MDSLFGAVLTQLPELEKNLLVSWLQVQGFVVKECTQKTWKDHPDSLRLFSKPTPEIAKELLDWGIEPISHGKKKKIIKMRVYHCYGKNHIQKYILFHPKVYLCQN